MTATERNTDLISVIISDHREVERVFAELEDGAGTPEHRKQLVDHVICELVRHSVAEEQYMYPAARRVLPDGDELVDHELAEHAEAERTMARLQDVPPTDPRFDPLVRKLAEEIRHHLQDEEKDLLPRLRDACDADELLELGRKVLRAKQIAPTRPHPNAPDTPPANLVVGPGLGLIDRVRDALGAKH